MTASSPRLQTKNRRLLCNLRTPVKATVAAVLDAAPTHERSGFPTGFTYHDLAREVYGAAEPSAAQLSAVRRAVAGLVADGRAERVPGRELLTGRGWHERRRRRRSGDVYVWEYQNPPGVVVRRPATAADREARAAAVAGIDFRKLERAIRGTAA